MEAKQIINGQWERALALTFQLKQIIIREACVDHVQLRRPGAGGACQEIAPRRIRLRSFSRSLGTRRYVDTTSGSGMCMHFYDRAWHYNLLFMAAM